MPNGGFLVRRDAPAKINLGLHVLRKRPDGYHDIETIMVPIDWCDVLLFEPGDGGFRLTCSDSSLPTDERNLCVQAAHLFRDVTGFELSGRLHLQKEIPHGAGLGGGSSDAAATLRLLHEEWARAYPGQETLYELACRLGSDVPFFLADGPRLASSKGEVLSPIGRHPYALPFDVAVIMPPVTVSTANAYRFVSASDEGRPDLKDLVVTNDLALWREELRNDFQQPVFERYPGIVSEWRRLIEAGAGYASLTGSGAAVYGLFEEPEGARRAVADAIARGLRAWSGRPRASGGRS